MDVYSMAIESAGCTVGTALVFGSIYLYFIKNITLNIRYVFGFWCSYQQGFFDDKYDNIARSKIQRCVRTLQVM